MFCPNCGTYNADEAQLCISCQYALSGVPEQGAVVYAGFLDRLAALMIDSLLLVFAFVLILAGGAILIGLSGLGKGSDAAAAIYILLAYLLFFLLSALYYTLMEASGKGGTLGKRLMKIRVVDMAGNRISKLRSLGRWLAHGITNMSMYIGYIMQPFTEKKQALHDLVCGTQVIRTTRQGSNAVVAVIIVAGMVFFFFFFTGIIAAVSIPAYQDYIVKAKLKKGEMDGRQAALAVEQYYHKTGRIPASLEQTKFTLPPNNDIGSVTVNSSTAVVKVTFSDSPGEGRMAGKSLVFTPQQDDSGSISWKCSSPDFKPQSMLPADCH